MLFKLNGKLFIPVCAVQKDNVNSCSWELHVNKSLPLVCKLIFQCFGLWVEKSSFCALALQIVSGNCFQIWLFFFFFLGLIHLLFVYQCSEQAQGSSDHCLQKTFVWLGVDFSEAIHVNVVTSKHYITCFLFVCLPFSSGAETLHFLTDFLRSALYSYLLTKLSQWFCALFILLLTGLLLTCSKRLF